MIQNLHNTRKQTMTLAIEITTFYLNGCSCADFVAANAELDVVGAPAGLSVVHHGAAKRRRHHRHADLEFSRSRRSLNASSDGQNARLAGT
jgi:hypothetical protein